MKAGGEVEKEIDKALQETAGYSRYDNLAEGISLRIFTLRIFICAKVFSGVYGVERPQEKLTLIPESRFCIFVEFKLRNNVEEFFSILPFCIKI